jgi:integrase
LPPSAFPILEAYRKTKETESLMLGVRLNDSDLAFGTIEDNPLRPDAVTRAWSTMAAQDGVKIIRVHDARHTRASLMLKQGIHPEAIQERLGHASIAITLDTYSHVAPTGCKRLLPNALTKLWALGIMRQSIKKSISKLLAKWKTGTEIW